MENQTNETNQKGCGYLLFFCLIFIWALGIAIGADYDAFEKKVAKEYNLPLSVVEEMCGYSVNYSSQLFPYPHDIWYVTLENGSDVTVATAYFGIISLKKNRIDTYFPLRELRKEFKDNDFPFSRYGLD